MIDYNDNKVLSRMDIKQMINGVTKLWYYLTGSIVYATDEYINKVHNEMDFNQDGKVTFSDFIEMYYNDIEIYGWFEFLNKNETSL